MSVLHDVLDAARRPSAIVAFDLDSTLLDNRPRNVRVLREFGQAEGLTALLAIETRHFTSWNLRDAMVGAGVAPERAAACYERLRAFWLPRFFSSAYCAGDAAVPGAPELVRAVHDAGAHVAYVTGRYEEMRHGTLEALARWSFPLPGERVHLVMKPSFEESDDLWKREAHARLRAIGSVVAAFDNEPTHINGYGESFPDAILVHLATDHSGRPVALRDGVQSIRDFRR
ncbi:MAG: HAD family hydrolase [Myxococcota bacterium]